MIAHCGALDQRVLAVLRDHDPVVRRYRTFFAHLDWRVIPAEAARPRPGPVPHPTTAYVKALLIKLCEHKSVSTNPRPFHLTFWLTTRSVVAKKDAILRPPAVARRAALARAQSPNARDGTMAVCASS